MSNTFDSYDSDYARMGNEYPDWESALANPELFACSKPWLPEDKNSRILDFGCGWGNQLLSLWCAGYRNIEGVDLQEDQARIAQEYAGDKVRIHCMDGRKYIEDQKASYDLIIMNDVFEHIPPSEARDTLNLLYQSLKDGGVLVLRVPNMARVFAAYMRYVDVTHVAGYTELSLTQILNQAGFVDHQFVLDIGINWKRWRPWVPWRGLAIRWRLANLLHKFLYWILGYTVPRCVGQNIEMYATKPDGKRSHDG